MTTVTRPALLSALRYLMQAAGITPADLVQDAAEHARITDGVISLPVAAEIDIDAVHKRAPVPTQKKPPAVLGDQAMQVIALTDRPEGATVADVQELLGVHYATAAYHCDRLARARRVTKAKGRGEHAFRFFARPAQAAAYVEARQAETDQQAQADEQARQQREREREERAAQQGAAKQALQAQREQAKAEAKQARAEKAAATQGLRVGRKPAASVTMFPAKQQAPALRGDAVIPEGVKPQVDDTVRPIARWQTQQLPADPKWPSFNSVRPGVNPDTGRVWATAGADA